MPMPSSFAEMYDSITLCKYTAGVYANYKYIKFSDGSRYPGNEEFWVAGYTAATRRNLVVKIKEEAPIACSQENYFNQECLTATSTSCYPLCSACLKPNDPNACTAVTGSADPEIAFFSAKCPTLYQAPYGGSCSAITQTGCHKLCGGDCFGSSATKCAFHCTAQEPSIDESNLNNNECKCSSGLYFSSASERCVLGSGCHALCTTGQCSVAGDNTKCISCVVGANVNSTTVGFYKKCECVSGYTLVGGYCLFNTSCHALCNGVCSVQNDTTKCQDCATKANIAKTPNGTYFSCSCLPPTSLVSGLCVYSTGCHPLCNGNCIEQGNPDKCLQCAPAPKVMSFPSGDFVKCACESGYSLSGTECKPLILDQCHSLCDGGCIEPFLNSKCLRCKRGTNIEDINFGSSHECKCKKNAVLFGTSCVFPTGCHKNCKTCLVQNDENGCAECLTGILPALFSDDKFSCLCPASTTYVNNSCKDVLINNCHPLCNGSCVLENSSTSCLACKNSTLIQSIYEEGKYNCECSKNSYFNGESCLKNISCNSFCENCSGDGRCKKCSVDDSLILYKGVCICNHMLGFIEETLKNKTHCLEKKAAASKAVSALMYY